MKRRGFTLIELLISIILMMILVFAMMTIFIQTTDVVAVQDARMTVFTNARYAMDVMQRDLAGCLAVAAPPKQAGGPTNPGGRPPQQNQNPQQAFEQQQAFWMENGFLAAPGSLPSYNVSGGHYDQAGDRMGFRSTTAVGISMQTCEVTYELIPGDSYVDQQGNVQKGDLGRRQTVRTKRGLYTLIRRVRTADTQSDPPVFNQVPQVKDPVTQSLKPLIDQELCHYVVNFNLEYFSSNYTFSQLDPSPFPKTDPLGDNLGSNDGQGGGAGGPTTAMTVPAIRVTLVVVEDIGERTERTIQRVVWIPAN